MPLQTLTYMDRSRWGSGPWETEPDYVPWLDPVTSLLCVACRGVLGHWCGYCGVPPTHPAYGLEADVLDGAVHGGVTYTAPALEFVAALPTSAVLPPGMHECWLIGFDCAHSGDLVPALRAIAAPFDGPWEIYRTLAFVQAECLSLAAQLALMLHLQQHAAPPGSLCEVCLDAPAVVLQALPWAEEAGVCWQCAITSTLRDG